MWNPTEKKTYWKRPLTSDEIIHSAKGSHWKKHLYTKIVDGVYIYADKAKNAIQDKIWDAEIATDNAKEKIKEKSGYNAKQEAGKYLFAENNAEYDADKAYHKSEYYRHLAEMEKIYNNGKENTASKEYSNSSHEYAQKGNRMSERANESHLKAKAVMEKYYNTPLGKLDKSIEKGKSIFNKLIGKKSEKSEHDKRFDERMKEQERNIDTEIKAKKKGKSK